MQRTISISIARLWFDQLLTDTDLRRLESHASALSQFFEERIQLARCTEDPPPIGADSDTTAITPAQANEMFQALCTREDLEGVRICVATLRSFMRQRITQVKTARIAA